MTHNKLDIIGTKVKLVNRIMDHVVANKLDLDVVAAA